MKWLMMALMAVGSVNVFADSNLISGDMQSICEKAHIPLGNGNFKTVDTVVAQGEKLSFISHYSVEKDSNFITALDNQSGKVLFSVFLEGFKVADMEVRNEELWAVTNDGFKASELVRLSFFDGQVEAIKKYPTHNLSVEPEKYNKAYGLSVDEKSVYIAHGGLGIVRFDIQDEKPIEHINPDVNPGNSHRSYTTDLIVINDKLYLGMDNITYDFNSKTRAFEGYAILNKSDFKLVKRIPINQKREALFEPKLFYNKAKNEMIMSTWYLHFTNKLDKLEKSNLFVPERRIYRYKKGKPIGLASVKNGQITGCFRDDNELPAQSFAHTQKL